MAFLVLACSSETTVQGGGGTSTGGASTGGASTGGASTGGAAGGGGATSGGGSGGTTSGGGAGGGGGTGGASKKNNGAICAAPGECLSNNCVGNVCCSEPTCGPNAACAGGNCNCNTGFGNCDGNWATGCETNTKTDTSNCGTCGNACTNAPAWTCCNSACVYLCQPTVCKECFGCNGSEQCKGGTCGGSCS